MPQTTTDDKFLNYVIANRFYVEVESNISASFSECSGLGAKVKKETVFEGGMNDQQRVILGQTEYSDVTLKRGITDDLVFWNWVSQVFRVDVPAKGNDSRRRNVNILLFNQAGETMQCWTLTGAVPIGWKAPSLQANSNTVAIEELTLAYEGLRVEKSGGGGANSLDNQRDSWSSYASH